ncbi:MAG: glycogen/starch synthase [Bacteroidales bacterium]|jgi:starch synthase|nr:glycogen/starch synthase [Bacteroidales bacterium]
MKGRILYINQETYPYTPETKFSTYGRFLPQVIHDHHEKEVRVFMPNFGNINERKNQLHEVLRLSGLNIVIDKTDHPLLIKVASIPSARLQVYFIDNEDYFRRKFDVRDANGEMFEDNPARSIFFAHGVLETIKKLSWKPSVIHCSGWFSALVPFYVKRTSFRNNPYFSDSKVVISLFNDDFSEILNETLIRKLKHDGATAKDLDYYKVPDYISLMKAAINYSDGVVLADENANPVLLDHAKKMKKPIVEYAQMPDIVPQINELYDSIIVDDD